MQHSTQFNGFSTFTRMGIFFRAVTIFVDLTLAPVFNILNVHVTEKNMLKNFFMELNREITVKFCMDVNREISVKILHGINKDSFCKILPKDETFISLFDTIPRKLLEQTMVSCVLKWNLTQMLVNVCNDNLLGPHSPEVSTLRLISLLRVGEQVRFP